LLYCISYRTSKKDSQYDIIAYPNPTYDFIKLKIESSESGPLVWLTGCMHGDEVGGSAIIHEIFKKLRKRLIRGKVFAFPLMNPFGFENVSRNITISEEDLNRSFPGNPKGTLAQRISNQIFTEIMKTTPTLVLDLHNDWNKSIPYLVIDSPTENGDCHEDLNLYAKASGLVKIQDTEVIKNSLTYNLIKQGIPALTLELGESLIINEKNITFGINTIWNILTKLEMVSGTPNYFKFPISDKYLDNTMYYCSAPLCSTSGIIRFLKKPGEGVEKGEKIAKVFNAFGKLIENVTAVSDGIILGLTDYAVTFPGFPIMASGVFAKHIN